MVVMDADTYRKISALAEEERVRSEAALIKLSAEYDHHLSALQAEGVHDRIDDVMSAHGHIKDRPKAGNTY